MIKFQFTVICSLLGCFCFGQNFKQEFNTSLQRQDTIAQSNILEQWQEYNSEDPELAVAYFNYYVNKSMMDFITIGDNPHGENVLEILSTDSTQTDPEAYIYSEVQYINSILNKGFEAIDQGIEKNPTRLDMRLGKIYVLGQTEDYDRFTTEIVHTIHYGNEIQNKWSWEDGAPVEDAKNFLLGAVQDYVVQLYNTQNPDLLIDMQKIAEAVLQHYPDHIESLSNLSVVCLLKEDYAGALVPLLKAEKINPKDAIVLNNIAQAYKLKGDKKKAIKYYQLALKYGDEEIKEYAQEQIKELKKKK